MASIISAGTTSGTSLNLSGDTSGVLELASNGSTTAVTIDTSQNVGVGTSSIDSWTRLKVQGTAGAQTGAAQQMMVAAPTTTAGHGAGIRFNAASGAKEAVAIIGVVNEASGNSGAMVFHNYAGGADIPERMRIDSSGNLLVGITSTLLASGSCFVNNTVAGDSPQLILRNAQNTAGRYWKIGAVGTTGAAEPYMIVYSATNAGVYMGYGDINWSSTSDESKKENLVPITDAVTKISSLRTVIGNFIDDEEKTKHPFLIAQDVQKVLPEAVNEKDGVLGLKYSDMIPLLVASIKELKTELDSVKTELDATKAEVAALKGTAL